MKPRKILIIQTAFIGDAILATSLVELLKKELPFAQIDFLLRSGNESILETNPHIKNLLVWHKNNSKYKSLFKLISKVRKEKYDAVINIQRFFNSALLTTLSGSKLKIGFHTNFLSLFYSHRFKHKIPYKSKEGYFHEVQRNAELLSPLLNEFTIPKAKEIPPKIYFNDSDHQTISKYIKAKDYIVMAPSSVWFTKQWQKSKWIELIKMTQSNYKIYLIGAPSDRAYLESLGEHPNIINLAGELSLRESALLMKSAKRTFVNDSAPLHLGSSVNANLTAIFCSTVPDFGYTPLSADSLVIQLTPRLDCMPCGVHGHNECPLGHFNCSKRVSVEEVAKTLLKN